MLKIAIRHDDIDNFQLLVLNPQFSTDKVFNFHPYQ